MNRTNQISQHKSFKSTSAAKTFVKDLIRIDQFYQQYKLLSFDYSINKEELKKHIPQTNPDIPVNNLAKKKICELGLVEYKSTAKKYKEKLFSTTIPDILLSKNLKKHVKIEISPYLEDETESRKPPFTISRIIEILFLITLCLITAASETIMISGFLMGLDYKYIDLSIKLIEDVFGFDNAGFLYFFAGAIIPIASIIATLTYSNVKYKKGFSNSKRMKRFSYILFSTLLLTITFNAIYSAYDNSSPAVGSSPTIFDILLEYSVGSLSFLTIMFCSILALSIGTSLAVLILKSHSPISLTNNPAYIEVCTELSDIEEIHTEALRQMGNMESIEARIDSLSSNIISEYNSKYEKLLKRYEEKEKIREEILNEKF